MSRGAKLVGNGEYAADLLDRAGLERHVLDARRPEVLNQRDGVVQVGDAGGDDNAVNGRAGSAGALDKLASADLEAPEIGIQKERVEGVRTAGLKQVIEALDVGREDRLGHLAATGKLGPEAGVGRGGDDGGIDRRRGHPGQQDRRATGEPGELRLDSRRAVRKSHDGGLECAPRLAWLGSIAGDRQVAEAATRGRCDHPDAVRRCLRAGEAGGEVTGTEVDQPACASTPEPLNGVDPVDRVDHRRSREVGGLDRVDATALGPHGDQLGCLSEVRMVERGACRHWLGRSADLLEQLGRSRDTGRGTTEDGRASPVADVRHDARRVRKLTQCGCQLVGGQTVDAEHRLAQEPLAARHLLDGNAGEACDGKDVGVRQVLHGRSREDTLGVTGDRDGPGRIKAEREKGTQPSDLAQRDTGDGNGGHQQRVAGRQRRPVLVGG